MNTDANSEIDNSSPPNLVFEGEFKEAFKDEFIKRKIGDCLPVKATMDDLRRPLKAADPVITPLIGIGVAIATLGYMVWKDWKAGKTWDEKRLREHLNSELMAKGIVGFDIVAVNNFDEFREGKELCVVKGSDNNGKNYKIWLLLNGEVGCS